METTLTGFNGEVSQGSAADTVMATGTALTPVSLALPS